MNLDRLNRNIMQSKKKKYSTHIFLEVRVAISIIKMEENALFTENWKSLPFLCLRHDVIF